MQNPKKSTDSRRTTPTVPPAPDAATTWSTPSQQDSSTQGDPMSSPEHHAHSVREKHHLLPETFVRTAANYGATAVERPRRSLSVPSESPRTAVVNVRGGATAASGPKNPERKVQRAAAQAYAKSTFFHGSFTSSHGLTVTRASPRTPALLPAKRGSPQMGPARRAAPTRPPPLVPPEHQQHRGMHRRRSMSAGAMDRAMNMSDEPRDREGGALWHSQPAAGPLGRAYYDERNKSPLTAPSAIERASDSGSGFPDVPAMQNGSFLGPPAPTGTPANLFSQQTAVYEEGLEDAGRPVTPMSPQLLPPPVMQDAPPPPSMDPAISNKKQPHSPCLEHPAPAAAAAAVSTAPQKPSVTASAASDDDVVSWVDAMLELVPLALPSMVSMMLTYALTAVPLAFIGTYHGQVDLAGASVGYFILSIFAQYPITGLTFALDTLCSMEYGRDPNSTMQGVLLQRAILVNMVFLFPVCTLLFSLEGFLSLIYDDQIAAIAAKYLRFAPFFLCPLVCFTAFSKFCSNQLLPQMPMIAMVVGVIATPVVQRWCVPLGVEGAMLGMGISAWIQLSVLFALTLGHKQTRATLGTLRIEQAASVPDLKAYLKLALPSALFVAAEASAFDMSVLLAAKIGNPEGAAWSAILNSLLFFVAAAGGLSASAAAKVGASLGAGYPADARRYAFAAVFLATCICLMNSVVIYSFFDVLLSLFGTTGISLRAGLAVRWLAPFMHIADSIQFCFQGVFSGAGQNHKGAMILLSCLWAFGFPLSLVLAFFHGLGLQGVVGGLTIGLFVEIPFMTYYVHTMDWQALSDEAQLEEEDEEEEDEEEEGEASVEMQPVA